MEQVNILIPMAGAGKRFAEAGYAVSKPLIPTTCRYDGKKYPMVVCAVKDALKILNDDEKHSIIFIDRTDCDYKSQRSAVRESFPDAEFIGVNGLTEGQACTCLLAKKRINNGEQLLIAGCDNGMAADKKLFEKLSAEADCLIFTYRRNECVLVNPDAYGWVIADGDGRASGVSVKKALSEDPLNDHAIVASFWFKRGSDFVSCAEKMIAAGDKVNGEFYVDKVMEYCIKSGLDVRVYEIDRYIGWGTPADYENYEKTLEYWREFTDSRFFLGK